MHGQRDSCIKQFLIRIVISTKRHIFYDHPQHETMNLSDHSTKQSITRATSGKKQSIKKEHQVFCPLPGCVTAVYHMWGRGGGQSEHVLCRIYGAQ